MLSSAGVNIPKLFTRILLLIRYGTAVYFAVHRDVIKNHLTYSQEER
jgi:hypothetical protein